MRDEMLAAVVRRAMEHEEFRNGLVEDPQRTLREHGFALEDEEMREIETLRGQMKSGDATEALERIADRYGVEPQNT